MIEIFERLRVSFVINPEWCTKRQLTAIGERMCAYELVSSAIDELSKSLVINPQRVR